jgi:hypothetical protein
MTNKPEKPKGLTLPAVHTGKNVQDQFTEISQELNIVPPGESISIPMGDEYFVRTATPDAALDTIIGGMIANGFKGSFAPPFTYTSVSWKDIDFLLLSLDVVTPNKVVVISNNAATNKPLNIKVWNNEEIAGKPVNTVLNAFKYHAPHTLPTWTTVARLLMSPEVAMQHMEVGRQYLVPGALVLCGSYYVPVVEFSRGMVYMRLKDVNGWVEPLMGVITV